MSHAPISGFTQLPQPDFGATSGFTPTAPSATANPNYVMRLGENPPVLTPDSPTQQVFGLQGPPANGLSFANSLYYQQASAGYAVSQNYHTPYVNNWNSHHRPGRPTIPPPWKWLTPAPWASTCSWAQEDLNPKNSSVLSAELAQNISTTGTINDPLGRMNPITGKVLSIQNGTLGSPYLGFSQPLPVV